MATDPMRQSSSEICITDQKDLKKPSPTEEIARLSRESADISAKFQHLFDQYSALVEEKKRLDDLLQDVLGSSSWKITAPLRLILKIKRSIFPLLRFSKVKTDRVELNHVSEDATGLLCTDGPLPFATFSLNRSPLPSGWIRFSFKINNRLYFYISFDEGHGFTDEFKRFVTLDTKQNWVTFPIPAGIKGVRIDFFETGESFRLDGLTIFPLGKLQAAYYIARQKLGPSPQYWLPKLLKAFSVLRAGGFAAVKARLVGDQHTNNYQEWVDKYDTITDQDRQKIRAHIEQMTFKPLISVIMPVFNTPEEWLRLAIDSVRNQLYTKWELCIADDLSTKPHVRQVLEEYSKLDPRIKVIFRNENGHISEASNSALSLAHGEYIALLDHDDELREHALYMNVVELNAHPEAKLIFSDEDKITTYGMRFNPYFKSGWNHELFLQQNFICHLSVFKHEVLKQIGGFRKGFEGSQDWDLTLRVIDSIKESEIRHIPHILYHWRSVEGSTAQSSAFKPYALKAGARAVKEHLDRLHIKASVETLEEIAHYRIHYAAPDPLPLVSIIMPTKDKLWMLSRCIGSLLDKTTYPNFEIIIIDNGSVEENTLRYFESIVQSGPVRVIRDDRPFNFSRLNNFAVTHAKGSMLAFLNNDLEVITPEWLNEMVSHAALQPNGAIGARLWYPNGLLQHGGVILGIGGVAGHNHKGRPKSDVGYFNRAILTQNFSAVTAACLVVRREIFDKVGGFDEENLSIAFNDVDFCIKIRECGYKNVWTPYAEFFHYESVSRGYEHTPEKFARFERETAAMKDRWKNILQDDPFYNPNLTIQSEDFRLAFPPRVIKPWLNS